MKTQSFIIPICSLLIALPAMADVFVLKDGSRLEGSILREEGSNYVLNVLITKSIRDEKVVAKADVVRIERERLDLNAFEEIKKLVPTPDLLSKEDYAARISAVNKFLKTYPTSTKKAEATKILGTLESEASAVAAGGMKIKGEIVAASDYKANAYDIDASKKAAEILAAKNRGDLISALRSFDELEKEFKGSKAYNDSIPVTNAVLNAYEAQIKNALDSLPARQKEQKVGLDRMAGGDRVNAESALTAQMAEVDARFKAEKADKQTWVSVDPLHKTSLEDAERAIQTSRSRLNSYKPSSTQKDPGQAYRDLWNAVQARDPKEITTTLSAAKSSKVPSRYIDPLETQGKVIKVEVTEEAKKAKAAAEAEKAAKKAEEAAEKDAALKKP